MPRPGVVAPPSMKVKETCRPKVHSLSETGLAGLSFNLGEAISLMSNYATGLATSTIDPP